MENIIHCFEWKIKHVDDNLEKIKESGYTAVLVGPVQYSKEGHEWWKLYQPYGFSIGNKLGTKEDLEKLCYHAKFLGIKVIVDVVIEHVASDEKLNLVPHEKVDKTLISNHYFWKEAIKITNWNDRSQVVNLSPGLPTMDTSNYELQDIIYNFLLELINIGVNGVRIDSAKNISLPEENGNHFYTRVIGNLPKDFYVMSELIFIDEKLLNMYSKYTKVLTENQSYKNKSKLVTFAESHDSYLEFKSTAAWDKQKLIKKYQEAAKNNNGADLMFYVRPLEDKCNNLWCHPDIIAVNKTRL